MPYVCLQALFRKVRMPYVRLQALFRKVGMPYVCLQALFRKVGMPYVRLLWDSIFPPKQVTGFTHARSLSLSNVLAEPVEGTLCKAQTTLRQAQRPAHQPRPFGLQILTLNRFGFQIQNSRLYPAW